MSLDDLLEQLDARNEERLSEARARLCAEHGPVLATVVTAVSRALWPGMREATARRVLADMQATAPTLH